MLCDKFADGFVGFASLSQTAQDKHLFEKLGSWHGDIVRTSYLAPKKRSFLCGFVLVPEGANLINERLPVDH